LRMRALTTTEEGLSERLPPDRGPAGGLGDRVLFSRELVYSIAALGILLRVAQYVFNRSLWVDEASLALNIVDQPLTYLFGQLHFAAAAPVGFLLTEGIVAKALGQSEYALRLFPLICGLLSIPAFIWIARRTLAGAAVPLATLLFVVADGLIYYSSELKPYSTDVSAALGLYIAAVLVREDAGRMTRTTVAALALGGLALVAFSFSAIFVVAAVALTLAGLWIVRDRSSFTFGAAAVVLTWLAASIGIAIYAAPRARLVRESFEPGSGFFLGVPEGSSPLHALNAMGTNIATAIGLPQTRPLNHIAKLALLCSIVGGVALLRRNPLRLSMLILPFPLLLGASALHAYPLLLRTELFLVPAILLLVAEGVYQLGRWAPARVRLVVAPLLAALVAAGPVWAAARHVVHPRTHEEVRPVLEFVRDHWRQGDALYVHYGAQPALVYYEQCQCVRLSSPNTDRPLWPLKRLQGGSSQFSQAAIALTPDVILGRSFSRTTGSPYVNDLRRVERHRRVWFIYSHLTFAGEENLVQAMLRRLDSLGTRIDGIDRKTAHAYLYVLAREKGG